MLPEKPLLVILVELVRPYLTAPSTYISRAGSPASVRGTSDRQRLSRLSVVFTAPIIVVDLS